MKCKRGAETDKIMKTKTNETKKKTLFEFQKGGTNIFSVLFITFKLCKIIIIKMTILQFVYVYICWLMIPYSIAIH